MDTLNSALEPVKPTLRSLLNKLPPAADASLQSLLGSKCHLVLVKRLDFGAKNSACLQLAASKALGSGIVASAAIVKVPQLVKLVSSQSAVGLSFVSILLETAAFGISLAYAARNQFPFSTYGETAFIAIQDIALGALILLYQGKGALAAVFAAGVAAAGYALFSPDLVDMGLLRYFQAGAGGLAVASKLPQIYTNWRNGSTGQLSAFAVFFFLAGSISRIFTTLQEVDDPLILYGFLAGGTLNAVLAAQMLYYWNSPATVDKNVSKVKPDTSHIKRRVGIETKADKAKAAPVPVPESARKAPSTRRRG